uniref:Ig-like domain-containing protein n=1 Tax=Anabas testudineus TaxID=64144 RepID=A0A3Q1H5Y8_ANATE
MHGYWILCCTDTDHIFDTKTVDVGDDVTLKCTRQISQEYLFWIRLVSGTFPEILGKTLSSDYGGVDVTRHITAKQEPGEYVLNINKAQLTDTAVYYCVKVTILNMSFLKGTFLRVKGNYSKNIYTDLKVKFSSDPLRPGESMTLQCSVLSESENRTCPDHSMYWFRAGSDESPHTLMYVDGNTSDQCEKSPEARSLQTCVYSFSKNVSSSDAGTYYCAVATCGQILFGNGTQVHIEDLHNLLSFSISFSQRNKESLVYSTVLFTRRTAGKAGRRNAEAKEQTGNADVRTFVT